MSDAALKGINSNFRIVVLVLLSFLVLCFAPLLGSSNDWGIGSMVSGEGIAGEVFWRIRVPRVILAWLAGASLAGAGVVFQALFRNPLASPYTLGVASGASFGAILFLKLGVIYSTPILSAPIVGGVVGSIVATLVVYFLYSKTRAMSSSTMLLAGVAASFFFSSLSLFVQYFSNFVESFEIIRWLMGGLETVDYGVVLTLLPFVLTGLGFSWLFARDLDVLSLGDEMAASRGVDVSRSRLTLFLVTSLVTGAVVSFVGPIGFVGIIIPHFVRNFVGVSNRRLIPMAAMVGGSFLVFCDCLSRILLAPVELPVGIVTAILGGPFFILILSRRGSRWIDS